MGSKSGLLDSAVLGGQASAGGTLLLDGIGSLGAVYSFRKLVSAYAGNCATIHESGGNTDQTFGFVGNVIDPAAATFGSGTRTVKTWFDQSGNGVDVTNPTVATQPLYIASGINSLPSARFDDTTTTLASANIAASTIVGSNEGTFFVVANESSGGDNQHQLFFWKDSDRYSTSFSYDDVLYFDFGTIGANGRVSVSEPVGWDNAGHVSEGYRTTGNVQAIVVDGAVLVSSGSHTDTIGTGSNQPLTIGSGAGIFFKGDISEIVLLKNDTGSTNRSTIRKDGVGGGVAQGMGPYYGITVA